MEKKKEVQITGKAMTLVIINRMAWAGTNPIEHTLLSRLLSYFYVFCSAVVVILMGLNFYFTPHENVSAIVKDMIIFVGFMQITFKQITAIQKKATIRHMLESAWSDFWPLNMVNENVIAEIQELYKKTNILTIIYVGGAMSAVISIIIQSWFIQDKRTLVMEIWIPHIEILQLSPYYEIVFAVQTVVIILGVYICVTQLDKLFLVMICLVFVQFKMIKVKMQEISTTNVHLDNFQMLRTCVIHHNTLLRFVAQFEKVYSRLFLPTVASNILIATVCMWGFMNEVLLSNKLSNFCVYFTVMSQVLLYCIAGQIVQDAAQSLGKTAYEVDWTGVHDYNLRMGLIMMMTQASRKVELTVGGFMVLCMESFAALLRASFSFLAFIINTQN